ncbi:MAG: hypothetical protein L3J26_02550 [Candidatus Polarisedimenticolaceae bacterium]|nr:hypothetical protein [Candidatus Polarisedimenticolaceae bacterium]
MSQDSKKALATAMVVNAGAVVLKLLTAFAGGSPSMMNGAIHNLVSTLNQAALFFGWVEAARPAVQQGGSGSLQKRALWDRWGTTGLFATGAVLGLVYAWYAWHELSRAGDPALVELLGIFFDPLGLALAVLGLAFIMESYAFLLVLKVLLSIMRREGISNPFRYLAKFRKTALVVVLLESAVALLGLVFAVVGIGLRATTGSAIWDIGCSVLIAILLGGMAFYSGAVRVRSA